MEFADPDILESRIKATLNAAKTFGGAVVDKRRNATEIQEARRAAAFDVLKAIANYPQGGYYGEYSVDVAVNHNAFLPAHEGEPGIPQIVPFDGANPREGEPASVSQIDSFRESPELYTGQNDGKVVAHDQKTAEGKMSPISCRYNITGARFKFTGKDATVPLFPSLTEDMADNKIPLGYGPAVHKRAVAVLLKEGDNLGPIAAVFNADGKQDLIEISGGAMRVNPVRSVADIMREQKQSS